MHRILPYAFHGLDYLYEPQFLKLYHLIPAYFTNRLGEGFLQSTSFVYSSLLQAMAEQDKEYLQQILEPKLYHAVSHCMDMIKEQNLTLQYIENQKDQDEQTEEKSDEEKEQQTQTFGGFGLKGVKYSIRHVYDEKDYKCNLDMKGVFGVKINREENEKTKFYKIPAISSTPRNYYINLKKLTSVYEDQILVANVLIYSNKKLVAIDEEGKCVHGSTDLNQYQYHKLRLESYIPNYNWVITDIDDYLKGNPYF